MPARPEDYLISIYKKLNDFARRITALETRGDVTTYSVTRVGYNVTSSPTLTNIGTGRDNFAHHIQRITIKTRVSTTNDGANFWTITVRAYDIVLAAFTDVYEFDTSGDAVDTHIDHSGPPDTANPANYSHYRINHVATGSPGDLNVFPAVHYQLIGAQ